MQIRFKNKAVDTTTSIARDAVLVLLAFGILSLHNTRCCAQVTAADTEVVFEPLALDDPVTCMDMSEDGKFLVFSHQGEGKVTVYDVVQKIVTNSWETPAPRTVLWRGGNVIVANRIEGMIRVFPQSKGFKLAGEFQVPKPGINHIAAPKGRNFRNELIATCHGEGVSASYQDSMIFAVNVKTGRFKPISKAALVVVSYDGRVALQQESFNLSSYGRITAYNYPEYLQSGDKARKLFSGGARHQTPYAYQVTQGGYWIGGNKVFGGIPITQLGEDLGDLVLADGSAKMVYALTKDMISAHRLNAAMTHENSRRVRYPNQYAKDNDMLFNRWADRSYLLDHPAAYTHGNRTYLFFKPAKGGLVLAAETSPFAPPKITKVRPQSQTNTPPEPKPTKPAPPKPRKWSTKDGKFTVEAVLVQASDEAVVLRRSDNGKIIAVPPDVLSDDDQQYLREREQ